MAALKVTLAIHPKCADLVYGWGGVGITPIDLKVTRRYSKFVDVNAVRCRCWPLTLESELDLVSLVDNDPLCAASSVIYEVEVDHAYGPKSGPSDTRDHAHQCQGHKRRRDPSHCP